MCNTRRQAKHPKTCGYCYNKFHGNGKYISSSKLWLCGGENCINNYQSLLKCKFCGKRRWCVEGVLSRTGLQACSYACIQELVFEENNNITESFSVINCACCSRNLFQHEAIVREVHVSQRMKEGDYPYYTQHLPFCDMNCRDNYEQAAMHDYHQYKRTMVAHP